MFYKLKYTEQISDDILKDCPRCNFSKCEQFKCDPRTLKNPLFNVLNAYAHYDPEVAYGQGMNYVTANILAYTQHAELKSPKIMGNQRTMDVIVNEESWPFDEVTAFYILVFIMEDKGWREIIRPGIPGLMILLETIEQCLSQDLPQVVDHLQNELQLEQNDLMTFLFTDNIISLFISKLKEVCPLQLI